MRSNQASFLGLRYMDDLFAVLATGDQEIHDAAHQVMSEIEYRTYHKNMELECENTSEPFKYLCSEVRASGVSFDIKFHNRNAAHFINTGTQLFPCFQHWHSFSPCKQKLAVVISTFHRISRSCNSWTNVLDAVSIMKHELLSLKYPLRVLLRAAGRMATTDARWASIEGAWRADSRR